MNVPDWWELALLTFASYRIYRLLAEDTILDRPRRRLLRLGKDWEKEGDRVPDDYREKWGLFLTCPWCAGFWITLAWWAAWQVWPHTTLVWASLFTVSALVGLVAKNLDREE